MRKQALIFIALLLSHFADAQKLIYVSDSTLLKQYGGGRIREIVSVSRDNKVTVTKQAVPDKPAQENDGIPGSPIVRPIRNDNAAILRKELNAITRAMDWSPVLTGINSLHYRAFVSSEGKIDSLAYYLVNTDTTRRGREFWMRDKLGKIEQEGFRKELEAGLMKGLQSFTPLNTANLEKYSTGNIPLRAKPKSLDEFLNSQADTISTIHLTDFALAEFPHQLKRFRNLKTIILKDNFITSATLDRKDYPKLTTISLQNNLLRDNSLRFTGKWKAVAINLTDNHFTSIPATYRKVTYLYLANNAIGEVSRQDIRKIKKIQFLNLYGNLITEVNPKIARLRKLKELDLYRNRLTALPSRITRMKKLETLAVSFNQIQELPTGIQSMRRLKTLYSHHNKLKTLPPLPKKLEILDVGYNQIRDVSAQVQPLKNLKTLDYSYNQVKGDLDFLLGLPEIREIYFMENRYAGNEEEEKYFSRVFTTLVSKGVTVK